MSPPATAFYTGPTDLFSQPGLASALREHDPSRRRFAIAETFCLGCTSKMDWASYFHNAFALPYGRLPTIEAAAFEMPAIAIAGESVAIPPKTLLPVPITASYSVSCRGVSSCTASIEHASGCLDQECRFLPEHALLFKASLSIDIACTDFATRGKFVEGVRLCRAPRCAPPLQWNRNENKCCDPGGSHFDACRAASRRAVFAFREFRC